MAKEDMSPDKVESRWFINLDWYQPNNRSFSILAGRCLCNKCRKRLQAEDKEIPAEKLLEAIKDCCSKETRFITSELPILESIFRLFLANGNQPLDLEELSKNLLEWRGGDTRRASVEVLSRLLGNERYYGLRQVP